MKTRKNALVVVQVITLLAMTTIPTRLLAQQDEPACTTAEESLRSGAGGESHRKALGILMGCPVVGPQALALEWTRPQKDTVALRLLGDASAWISDVRMLRALETIVTNETLDREVRLTAIRSLVGQFDPSLEVIYRAPAHPELGGEEYVMLGTYVHGPGRSGAQQLSAADRIHVLDVLQRLTGSGSDVVIQKVAAYLLEELRTRKT